MLWERTLLPSAPSYTSAIASFSYTGQWVENDGASGSVQAVKDSTQSGTLTLQGSNDGVTITQTVSASTGSGRKTTATLPATSKMYRVKYVNGVTAEVGTPIRFLLFSVAVNEGEFVSVAVPGLLGATAASRYVGATTGGAPVTGTFRTGDFVVDQAGTMYVCTADGSPGTWATAGASILPISQDIPSALGWDQTSYPLTASLTDMTGVIRAFGTCSLTARNAFDTVSVARSAPLATFYVDAATGNDANDGLTPETAFLTIKKGTQAANAAGVATKIIVANGTYNRLASPNSGTTVPTVDIAYVATGGRVMTGSFDTFTATLDGTYTNCYTVTVSANTVNRVVDILSLNRFGNYVEFTNVASAAICNALPNSWAHIAGTLYIHRADMVAVTTANTRYYRTAASTLRFTNPTNIFIGGVTSNDGWDFEGGHANGVLSASGNTYTSDHVIAAENSTFKYGGGLIDTIGRGVSIGEWRGLSIFENCRADANLTDGFNFHDAGNVCGGRAFNLTINCTGSDNGRASQTSCNGHTMHEDCIGIDIAGYYEETHGGAVRIIDTSRAQYVGTTIVDDRGDISWGGSVNPTAFRADGTAMMWCDRTRISMPAGGTAYSAASAGSTILKRNVWPTPLKDVATGTIGSY